MSISLTNLGHGAAGGVLTGPEARTNGEPKNNIQCKLNKSVIEYIEKIVFLKAIVVLKPIMEMDPCKVVG